MVTVQCVGQIDAEDDHIFIAGLFLNDLAFRGKDLDAAVEELAQGCYRSLFQFQDVRVADFQMIDPFIIG